MIASMFHNEDRHITAEHGIINDTTIDDGQTIVIYHTHPNLNMSRSKMPYSVGKVTSCRQRHSGRRCRVWYLSSKHSTIELAIAAAKKLDTTTEAVK